MQKATTAKENIDSAQIRERIQLAYHSALTGGQGSYTKETLLNELKKEFGEEKITDETIDTSIEGKWTVIVDNVSIDLSAGINKEISKDIFVTVYSDGTLILSNNQKDIDNSKVLENCAITNIKEMIFDNSNTMSSLWKPNYPTITQVDIINEIYPQNMNYWFATLGGVTEIQHIQNINTKNVTSMEGLFFHCNGLVNVDLSNFNTSNVTNMAYMFFTCYNLEALDLSSFDTSNVTDMSGMFWMFDDEPNGKITTIFVGNKWDTSSVTSSDRMFERLPYLVGGEGTQFKNSNSNDVSYAHIDGGTSNPGYFTMIVMDNNN